MNSLRFLLVHSDAQQSERISAVLAHANHTVLPAFGLDEAADALTVEQFDAVLLESEFVNRGLAEFSARLRTLEDGRRHSTHIPLIAIDGGNRLPGESLGFDAVMPEPIDPQALTAAVGRLAQAVNAPSLKKAAVNTASMPVIEPEKFEEQVGGDRELMVEIIDLFLEERKRQEPEMLAALEGQQLDTLAKLAHTIKGSLGSLHAAKAWHHAQELETAATYGDEKSSWSSFAALQIDLAELESALLSIRVQASSH